jgi:guanylate kinase
VTTNRPSPACASRVSEYSQYDYLVINDEVDKAVARLQAIITAERARTTTNAAAAAALIGTFA